jgi:hypothetical protein
MKSKRQPDAEKPLTPAQARSKLHKGLTDFLAGDDPGPINFRLKRTKKADETYPLKLTQQQRESMIHATRINSVRPQGSARLTCFSAADPATFVSRTPASWWGLSLSTKQQTLQPRSHGFRRPCCSVRPSPKPPGGGSERAALSRSVWIVTTRPTRAYGWLPRCQ